MPMTRIASLWPLLLLIACGCAASRNPGNPTPVKCTTFRGVPVDRDLEAAAIRVAERDFTEAAEILGEERDKTRFRIEIKTLWRPNRGPVSGYARGRVIYINLEELGGNPDRLAWTLRHEMVHLLQTYAAGAPIYWREGICDYVAQKLAEREGGERCECSVETPHFTEGYRCAAAFLRFMEETYRPGLVSELHDLLTTGGYSDDWFAEQTGKTLEEMWGDFDLAGGVSALAREKLALQEALRRPGLSHEEGAALFRSYLAGLPGGPQVISAGDHLKRLAAEGKLPGPKKAKLTRILLSSRDLSAHTGYPRDQSVRFVSEDDRYVWVYEMRKDAEDAEWKLIGARQISYRTGRPVNRGFTTP
jgi:hypothetical protein